MPDQKKSLSILWWNAADFYHYDHEKLGNDRWPKSNAQYQAKCAAVDKAFKALFHARGMPDIVTLGEITANAAKGLRDRLFPGYNFFSLDTKSDDPTLQVAVIYQRSSSNLRISESPPIIVPATPRGTRPMAVIDISIPTSDIRCVVCHWQARFDEKSEQTRYRIADFLSQYVYDYLHESASGKKRKSVMIVGDLNDEPFGTSTQDVLNAHRHRSRSNKTHWADNDVKRVHLYNCSWRLLGERSPHPLKEVDSHSSVAGTFYWETKKSWHHLDHFIVSAVLLGNEPPFINESEISIVSLPEFMPDGIPRKFSSDKGGFSGLSDHLPIFAEIQLKAE